jgi:hypothetical protein
MSRDTSGSGSRQNARSKTATAARKLRINRIFPVIAWNKKAKTMHCNQKIVDGQHEQKLQKQEQYLFERNVVKIPHDL